MRVNKDLKDLNLTDLDFLQGALRRFRNNSLCPYYRVFGTNVKNYESIKKLKKMVDGCIKNMV